MATTWTEETRQTTSWSDVRGSQDVLAVWDDDTGIVRDDDTAVSIWTTDVNTDWTESTRI